MTATTATTTEAPTCASCEHEMVPAWGMWQCVNENCTHYCEPKTRQHIENEIGWRWDAANEQAFHDYHSY